VNFGSTSNIDIEAQLVTNEIIPLLCSISIYDKIF
jgi:hypothetical protein